MLYLRVLTVFDPKHRLRKQSYSETFNKVSYSPRTSSYSRVKVHTMRALPSVDEVMKRSVRHADGIGNVIGGAHLQHCDRNAAFDQTSRNPAHGRIASPHRTYLPTFFLLLLPF